MNSGNGPPECKHFQGWLGNVVHLADSMRAGFCHAGQQNAACQNGAQAPPDNSGGRCAFGQGRMGFAAVSDMKE
ncbi:hypothetical protein AA0313_1711 [Acetobacter indonesiensis NRIC 0313]|uniref:Uncharacterized protein n=1 Tax=Acetobacter indonesiensis TaxID=104101 RepID=A0ABQ0K3Y4_9PROT|nr:hypothetical protein Abin_002_135 [Acetobacter indonesiensis]GBQ58164.1 hypothetical protein AA0313_1711 [Acetobacter indonesiensis NRIC 0313]